MEGIIVKAISNDYTVQTKNKLYICKARGKFRNNNLTPLVGDHVVFDDKQNYILEIKPRKNELKRPPVANIDQAIIITSVKKPDFSANLLDKLLVIITNKNIKPVIIFTKLDLLNEEEKTFLAPYINYYKSIGFETYLNTEIEKIKQIFKDKVSVFTGQSGAGKSTLLNKLNPNLNLKTDEISLALNRGKHTTRHTELLNINSGLVADTPGFSAIDLNDLTKEEIKNSFIEFEKYKENCQFRDCWHHKEKQCEVKNKVNDGTILQTRYDNYLKFIGKWSIC